MELTTAVITVSDKGSRGQREDTSGPAVVRMLETAGYRVVYTDVIPDEYERIKVSLLKCCDELEVCLVITTGGTGFSLRDVTPEATLAVIEKETRGISETMRAVSMTMTPMAMLSRAVAGIRRGTLIINLPGSEKAATENLATVLKPLKHGIEVLRGNCKDCASIHLNKENNYNG